MIRSGSPNLGIERQCFRYPNNRQNFAEGMNYILNQTAAKDDDLVLLLNNDVVIQDTQSIRAMIDCMTPQVGVVGCRLMFNDTNLIQHAGVYFPTHKGGMPWHFRAGEKLDDNARKNRYFQAVTGAVC